MIIEEQGQPLVSVIIPTFNRPDYLILALQSVLNQTYPNIEIIIADDSTDLATKARITPFLERYRNITYMKNETRLRCFGSMEKYKNLCKGEYINFLNDDDVFHPKKIETMIDYLIKRDDVSMVTSPRYFIDAEDKVMGVSNNIEKLTQKGIQIDDRAKLLNGEYLKTLMLTHLNNIVGEPTTPLIRKRDLNEMIGVYQNKQYGYLLDMATWLSVLSKGNVIYYMEPLSYFRIHEGQGQQKLEDKPEAFTEWYSMIHAGKLAGVLPNKVLYKHALMKLIEIFLGTVGPIVLQSKEKILKEYDLEPLMNEVIRNFIQDEVI